MRAESEAEDILVRTVLVRAPWRVADEGPIEGHQLVGLYRKMRERTDTWTGWSSGELAAIARDLGCGGFRRPDRMIQILRKAGLIEFRCPKDGAVYLNGPKRWFVV